MTCCLTDIVKLLLEAKANIDVQTETGDFPLHGAVFGNKPQVIEMLLKAGESLSGKMCVYFHLEKSL